MDLDTQANRLQLIAIYPDLATDPNFEILSPFNSKYNCIAWAMGYDEIWVAPFHEYGCWWPTDAEWSMRPEALIEAFQAEGFEMTDNCLLEEGYEKVVLYRKLDKTQWTHAARVVSNQVEYSKFGQMFDAHHSHGVLCNTPPYYTDCSYGEAFAYMKRPKIESPKEPSNGHIVVDLSKLPVKLR